MPFVFTHIPCGGSGKVLNPDFEKCPEGAETCSQCRHAFPEAFTLCMWGEQIECEGCNGKGKLELASYEWNFEGWQ
jgi:hypothetical protein